LNSSSKPTRKSDGESRSLPAFFFIGGSRFRRVLRGAWASFKILQARKLGKIRRRMISGLD
jgi:hypothetical protein